MCVCVCVTVCVCVCLCVCVYVSMCFFLLPSTLLIVFTFCLNVYNKVLLSLLVLSILLQLTIPCSITVPIWLHCTTLLNSARLMGPAIWAPQSTFKRIFLPMVVRCTNTHSHTHTHTHTNLQSLSPTHPQTHF